MIGGRRCLTTQAGHLSNALALLSARRVIASCVTLALFTVPSGAQVVRGIITASGLPVQGAVVTLERASGEPFPDLATYSALSSDSGAYSIRVPAAGSYRLTAKRIGVKRAESPEFTIADGETKKIDLQLEAVVLELPEVVVNRQNLCVKRPEERSEVSSLWDETVTLLTAARIAVRDTLFQVSIVRYTRALEPRTLRVKSEVRRRVDGMVDRPFRSLSGDSLHAVGYWRPVGTDTTEFYGLDAEALMSPAFVRDHCFHVAGKDAEHPGMIGLGFEPQSKRALPEVQGVLWLDGKSFELRSITFAYTQLLLDGSDRFGGEVYFARLASGIWIVRRWFLRMPQYATHAIEGLGSGRRQVFMVPRVIGVVEEGGQVSAAGMSIYERPAVITGTLFDSLGARVPGAVVGLSGTEYTSRTDAQGKFRLDSLPPGAFDLTYEGRGYEGFGVPAAAAEVALSEGMSREIDLHADRVDGVATRLCDGHKPMEKHGTLRLTVLDTLTDTPLHALRLRMAWQEYGRPQKGVPTVRTQAVVGSTDASGVLMFCELPSDVPLELTIPIDDERALRVATFSLGNRELATRVVRIRQ